MSPFSEDKRQSHGSSYSWPGFCAWADTVKEAEDLHKNHSQRGATSPAYLQTQTEIKGLTLHNAQNKPDCTCRILIANWQDPKWSTKAKVFCIQNKKQMDKTRYNGVILSENLCINDFIISDIKISITYISRLCIFLQSLQLLFLQYEAHDLIRQLTVNICAIFCCCGIEQWFSMDRMTG